MSSDRIFDVKLSEMQIRYLIRAITLSNKAIHLESMARGISAEADSEYLEIMDLKEKLNEYLG
jgi:hypothetical protein